jgi:tRNA U34 5-methylaminomethyl-2-thiouridine-forming methyltransferase MnmC
LFIPVKTADGSFTFYSTQFNEHYHGLHDGAYNESLHKHVKPACDAILTQNPKKITILDICFGLGYNTLTTLSYLKEKNYQGNITVYSPEFDRELIHALRLLPFPKIYLPFFSLLHTLTHELYVKTDNIEITVINGDAVKFIENCDVKFDIVYQDAFSPKQNPLLWNEYYFQALDKCLHQNSVITTYSQAGAVRRTLFAQGYDLFEHQFSDNIKMRPGTIASKSTYKNFTPIKKFQHQ